MSGLEPTPNGYISKNQSASEKHLSLCYAIKKSCDSGRVITPCAGSVPRKRHLQQHKNASSFLCKASSLHVATKGARMTSA